MPHERIPAAALPLLMALLAAPIPAAGAGLEPSRDRDWGRVAVHHFVVSGGAEEIAAVGRQIAYGSNP